MPYNPDFDITEVKLLHGRAVNQDAYYLTIVGYDTKNNRSYYLDNGQWFEYHEYDILPSTIRASALSGNALKRALDAL